MGTSELILLGTGIGIAGTTIVLGVRMFRNIVGGIAEGLDIFAEVQAGHRRRWYLDPEVSGGTYMGYLDLRKMDTNEGGEPIYLPEMTLIEPVAYLSAN